MAGVSNVKRTFIDSPGPERISYTVERPDGGWKRLFSDEEKIKLRPIAETLAMLDGNAFFGIGGHDFYEAYLPEAHVVYTSNGGDGGWAGEASWIQHSRKMQEDPTCSELWNKLQVVLELKRQEK